MLRKITTLVGILGVITGLILTSGCGTIASEVDTDNQNSKTQQKNMIQNRPEREADITGIVKSMIGNEVIITQVDMDSIREQMKANLSEKAEGETGTKTNNFVADSGGAPGAGMRGGGGGNRPDGGGATNEMREQMNEMMRENSLGDIKVLIPVGIPMYTRGTEASLADLAIESNITIWLDQNITDRKIAEFVTL